MRKKRHIICDRNVTVLILFNSVSPCDPDPCSNGGTCIDLNLRTEFFCNCQPGFTGTTCGEVEGN